MKARLVAILVLASSAVVAVGSTTGVAASSSPSPKASAASAASGDAPGAATTVPPLVNEQLITASLDASGLPLQAQIVNRIVATNVPAQEVKSQTSTNNVRNLENAKAPQVQGNSVVYSVGGPGQTSAATQATFGKPMPVALHAKYSTEGEGKEGIDPTSVAGRSGALMITYTATNTVAKVEPITYKNAVGVTTTEQQPVFAPFVGTVMAELAPGVALTDPGNAVVNTTAEGRTALLWNLVLYPPLGNYLQEMSFAVRGDDLQIPAVTMQVVPVANAQDPAVGFSSNLLSQSVSGNQKLAGGLTQLDDSAAKLADGAAKLSSGQQQQASGVAAAEKGSSKLTKGAADLTSGVSALDSGAAALSVGASKLGSAATALSAGSVSLSAGLDELAAGIVAAQKGAGTLADAVNQIAVGVGNASNPRLPLPDPPNPYVLPTNMTLVQAIWLVEDSVTALRALSLSAAADSGAAAVASTSAAASIALVYAGNCVVPPTVLSPADCARLQSAATQSAKALTKNGSAGLKLVALTAALTILNTQLLTKIEQGLIQVGTALKSTGTSSTQPGVYEGLLALQAGLVKLVDAAKQLCTGGQQLAAGGQSVGAGGQELADGNAKLSTGAQGVADGAKQLTDGSKQLTSGLGTLTDGAEQLASGGEGLAQGASDLQDQGTAAILNQVVDSSSQPALADAYLTAASARAGDAAPYPAPDGAVARVAYSFVLTPPSPRDAPTPEALIIGGLFLAALVMLAVMRIRRPSDPGSGFAPPPAPADPPSAAVAARG
ncbi:MAG: hypothetical protein WCI74_05165 [Actinomycetes bacterium]